MSEIERRGREPFDERWVKTALLDDDEAWWPLLIIVVFSPDLLILLIVGITLLIGCLFSLK